MDALLKTGKHTITALTRVGSKGEFPEGVKVVEVDYDNEESIVAALKDQQFLAITLSVRAPPNTHSNIVKAAIKAGVKYIMPNAYGGDLFNPLLADEPYAKANVGKIREITELGGDYIMMVCGFWYEWSLALGEYWYGIDIRNKKVVFYDDGKTKIKSSTWEQCGRAFAALLSLPESGASPSVADFKNKTVGLESFEVSQRDMLDSLHRVLGDTDADWTITYEPTAERYAAGLARFQKGEMTGFAQALYARGFYNDGTGLHSTSNDVLGLHLEDLDTCTKNAVEMVKSGWNPLGL